MDPNEKEVTKREEPTTEPEETNDAPDVSELLGVEDICWY